MRLFIAIELSDSVADALVRIQGDMYDRGVRGRFTPEENLHLTLAVIGEYPDPEAVLLALPEFEPFPLALEGVGRVGDVWWAGLRPSPALDALARRVRRGLAGAGIPFDRKRFSPHVTLIRGASGPMPAIPPRSAAMTVSAITLMRSDRGKRGMIYTALGGVGAAPWP